MGFPCPPFTLNKFPLIPPNIPLRTRASHMDRDLHERLILLEGDLPQREHSSYGDINALFNFYFTVEKKWLVKPQVLIRAAVEEEDAEEENEENVDAEEDEAGSIDSYGSPVIGTTAQEEDAEGDETGSVDSYRRLSTKEFLYPDFIICRFTPRRGQQILRFVIPANGIQWTLC
ncbi:hypothetical protein OPQ81_008461 [Rhizoctonia solani]|nr:hypothetical protein OPQ81_008461 [Rhizoctonia solani]